MNAFIPYIKNGFWFFLELVIIFFAIEGIYYLLGYYGELTIAVVLLILSSIIFVAALVTARFKDRSGNSE